MHLLCSCLWNPTPCLPPHRPETGFGHVGKLASSPDATVQRMLTRRVDVPFNGRVSLDHEA